MRPTTVRLLVLALLVVALLGCLALAGTAAVAGARARQCLDGRLPVQQQEWRSAEITGSGCRVTLASGASVLVPLPGPPFAVGALAAGAAVPLAAVTVLAVRRGARRGPGGQPSPVGTARR